LHHVKKSGKKKIWIPLERKTWVESKELEGESEEEPWEVLLLPILSLFLGWIFKSPRGEKWSERERRWWVFGLERMKAGEMMEEREGEG
jgi:hypothetical protein